MLKNLIAGLVSITMASCIYCGKTSPLISKALNLCPDCIRSHFEEIRTTVIESHRKCRERFNLTREVPKDKGGILCNFCANQCRMGTEDYGYCGLRKNKNNKLTHLAGTKNLGLLEWYFDPLPTNCVAEWFCPAGTGAGYPDYAYNRGPEYGFNNLAVFYEACSFNCLFCQNYHFRRITPSAPKKTASQLASAVNKHTSCICFFGGDPTPQLPHAIACSSEALKKNPDRILRICWETNGSMNRNLLKQMLNLSLKSGGCIKFDLKAFDEKLHSALCGVSNRQTLENFRWLGQFTKERPEPPLLVASTLLVPGYIDDNEVRKIAKYIANIDPNIPYSLLAFYPHFEMTDLPVTSRTQAEACKAAALEAGLKRVHIGNIHLLR